MGELLEESEEESLGLFGRGSFGRPLLQKGQMIEISDAYVRYILSKHGSYSGEGRITKSQRDCLMLL